MSFAIVRRAALLALTLGAGSALAQTPALTIQCTPASVSFGQGVTLNLTLTPASAYDPYNENNEGQELGFLVSSGAFLQIYPTVNGNVAYGTSYTGNLPPGTYTAQAALVNYYYPSGPQYYSAPCTFQVIQSGGAAVSRLQGQYAFLFQGYNGYGGGSAVGSFVADGNGNITGGEVDVNGEMQSSVSGTYYISQDGTGTLALTTSTGEETFNIAVPLANTPDVSAKGTGVVGPYAGNINIVKQTPVASPGGGAYALHMIQIGGSPKLASGLAQIQSDGSGSLTLDLATRTGEHQNSYSLTATAPDNAGRFVMTATGQTAGYPGVNSLTIIGYSIDAQHFFLDGYGFSGTGAQ